MRLHTHSTNSGVHAPFPKNSPASQIMLGLQGISERERIFSKIGCKALLVWLGSWLMDFFLLGVTSITHYSRL